MALNYFQRAPFNAEDYKLATFILLQLHQQEKSISDREMANLKFLKGQDGLIRLRSQCLLSPTRYRRSPIIQNSESEPLKFWGNIGLDYLGPTLMKKDGGLEKAWIMLVTCPFPRAVHLDVRGSLDTTTFINGFRRFVARRGKPRWVLSDNATGFKAASACIAAAWQETLNHTQKDPYFTEHEIYWKFIPELAPFFGRHMRD
ncbi:hypothetical protein DdX_20729 [Ditylenchus destructor]|uniref:Integrase catalytic domain-containing protein n=1 Tax=Ditylenchus destructor TaxID=166010 RepID=A0AAD4MFU2_9BILA|nr:hypothetical protein DdX_20729 [Ditylenchus destructor]